MRLLSRTRSTQGHGNGRPTANDKTDYGDPAGSPYEVLNIRREASQEEIRQAYKLALKEYHPDKVAHLGKDLQDLAKVRTSQIIAAYEMLKGNG